MDSRAMVDRFLRNLHTHLTRERRQKSVKLAVEPQGFDDLGAKNLERAPVVFEVHSRRPRDQAVREVRGQPAIDPGILPIASPTAHDVEPFAFEPFDHSRDVSGIVLEIAIRRGNQPTTRGSKTGGEGGRLAEILSKLNDTHVRITRVQPFERRERTVLAAVVYQNQLIAPAPSGKRLGDLLVERLEVRLFV